MALKYSIAGDEIQTRHPKAQYLVLLNAVKERRWKGAEARHP